MNLTLEQMRWVRAVIRWYRQGLVTDLSRQNAADVIAILDAEIQRIEQQIAIAKQTGEAVG